MKNQGNDNNISYTPITPPPPPAKVRVTRVISIIK